MRDFNVTDIVTEIPVGATRLVERIQIFDDNINEAREEFEVFLTVEGNFTVMYYRQTTACRIPESDRKFSCRLVTHLMYFHWDWKFIGPLDKFLVSSSIFNLQVHASLTGYHNQNMLELYFRGP